MLSQDEEWHFVEHVDSGTMPDEDGDLCADSGDEVSFAFLFVCLGRMHYFKIYYAHLILRKQFILMRRPQQHYKVTILHLKETQTIVMMKMCWPLLVTFI